MRLARQTTRFIHHSAKMASSSSPASKLVFAPAGGQSNVQAAQFTKGTLSLKDLNQESPISQFHNWFSVAQQASSHVPHPETCILSTAQLPSGRISSRAVYMKELDGKGFVIYSNFGTSQKAQDLNTNPWAALVFYWEELQRQVRVEGRTERLTAEESQLYFDTRARGSKIGAWSSKQSQVLTPGGSGGDGEQKEEADDGRSELEGWVEETTKKFEGTEDIPVPDFWGGLRIVPERVEFWQGRDSRLHDRFVYDKIDGEEKWIIKRLSP